MDSRPLLVFFSSERSGPARRMESLLAHLARKERERLRVMHVDLDRNPEVGQKFKITTVPTLVLVKEKRVVGRIAERPVVRDGQVVPAQIGYVAITFDHRVVDGARAAEFGLDVIRRLEQSEAVEIG